MKPRITVLTIGVDDLERSFAFYSSLGLPTKGIVGREFDHGAVAFFDLEAVSGSRSGRARVSHTTRDSRYRRGAPQSSPSGTTFGANRTSIR